MVKAELGSIGDPPLRLQCVVLERVQLCHRCKLHERGEGARKQRGHKAIQGSDWKQLHNMKSDLQENYNWKLSAHCDSFFLWIMSSTKTLGSLFTSLNSVCRHLIVSIFLFFQRFVCCSALRPPSSTSLVLKQLGEISLCVCVLACLPFVCLL